MSKKKSKSKAKSSDKSPILDEVIIVCKNTDFIANIWDHPINKRTVEITAGYCRKVCGDKTTMMDDILRLINKYFSLIDASQIVGVWKYQQSYNGRYKRESLQHQIKIRSNLSFNLYMQYIEFEDGSNGIGWYGSENEIFIINGNIVIINESIYLLFPDSKSMQKLLSHSLNHYSNGLELNKIKWTEFDDFRENVYMDRIKKIYKKNKIDIVKKFESEILMEANLNKDSSKARQAAAKRKGVNWSHIQMKFKEIELKKLIKGKNERKTKKLKEKFEKHYSPKDYQEIYEQIAEKYGEEVKPSYAGPLLLYFDNMDKQKCRLYYGKRKIFKHHCRVSTASV